MKLLLLLFTVICFCNAQVSIIANKSVQAEGINQTDIKYIYQLNTKKWSDGTKIKLFDYKKKTDLKLAFFKFIKKTPMQLKKEWLRAKLTGGGKPPKEMKSEKQMLQHVADTEGAIGYINSSKVTDDVIVIGTID